jgi:hypothetical protein
MNSFKKTLATGAAIGLLALPFVASAQTTTDGTSIYDSQGNLIQETTTTTPGVPSTGVGGTQALANVVLLVVSAATALVGGYFLTTGRKNVA